MAEERERQRNWQHRFAAWQATTRYGTQQGLIVSLAVVAVVGAVLLTLVWL